MSASYSIRVEPGRDLVRIRMSGFFTPDDVAAFLDAREQAHRDLRCAANAHLTLNDISAMKIQSQDIVAAFRDMLSSNEFRSRRLAFVVGPTLARVQVQRACYGRAARCFDDVASAEAWLFEAEEDAPPLPRRAVG
jgi:hypothetical protein